MDLVSLLVWVIIMAGAFGAAIWVISWMALPDPWGMLARIVMGLIMLVVILSFVTGALPLPKIVLWR